MGLLIAILGFIVIKFTIIMLMDNMPLLVLRAGN